MGLLHAIRFKDQAFQLREEAVLDAATSILASKGFDLMTMDDVAVAVGISKPSLYKHFKSKEELVGEALIRLIDGASDGPSVVAGVVLAVLVLAVVVVSVMAASFRLCGWLVGVGG